MCASENGTVGREQVSGDYSSLSSVFPGKGTSVLPSHRHASTMNFTLMKYCVKCY